MSMNPLPVPAMRPFRGTARSMLVHCIRQRDNQPTVHSQRSTAFVPVTYFNFSSLSTTSFDC
jgi:hypothetical protein